MENVSEIIKCQVEGCLNDAIFHIRSKNGKKMSHLCFNHAQIGKDNNFSNIF